MAVRRMPRRPREARSTKDRFGVFLGMKDSIDPPAADAQLARALRNCYPIIAGHHSRVVGRPGFAQLGAQLGSSGRRTGQLFKQFTKLDGTEYTIAVVGGHFYTLNWATSTWTEVLSAANLSGAGITLSQTSRVYAVIIANQLVISDGENTPWMWDGTTGGGLTLLSDCPVLYGPPTVYYAKLFGIKAAERSTAVWSEEADPTTGYEAGGFNNAWTIGQTDTNRLTRLLGANEALYVFRERSATLVTGPVLTDFASSGTREGVSSTVGTASPDSVHFVGEDGIMFADADGRPHLIRRGLEPLPVWEDFNETLASTTDIDGIQGYWDPTLRFSRMAYPGGRQLCWSHRNKALRAAAVFDGFDYDRIGVVENDDGEPRILHSDDGYVYVHGVPGGSVWNDGLAAGAQAIVHQVEVPLIGYDEELEKHWDLLDLMFITATDMTGTRVRIRTGYGAATAAASDVEAGAALWDVAFWDVDDWSSEAGGVYHASAGINAHGAFIDLAVLHDTLDEQFGFLSGKLTGRVTGRNPVMP